jgi:endonuclease/exonuclease/phosphatase family metal-dependent hydrolase
MTFLAGDFNAEITASEMALVKDRTVTGPLAFRGWNGSQPSRGGDVRIDFIFVAPGTTAADRVAFAGEELLWKDGVPAPTGRFTLSDHLPVLHRYQIAPAVPAVATPAVRPTAPVPGSATGSAE